MRIKVTNRSLVDIMIDINGNNNIEDKIILHPRATETVEVSASAYPVIKSTVGLIVNLLN